MTVSVGDPITAAGYNARVAAINKWFGDIYSSNTVSDPKSENSYGWGNTNASDVTTSDDVTADQENELIHRINLGVTNTGYGSSISAVGVNDIVYAATANSIDSNSSILDTNRAELDDWGYFVDAMKPKTQWNNSISSTATFTFSSYAEARYWFNSGSDLRFTLYNGGSSATALAWQDLFDTDMGILVFSYNDIAQTGSRSGNITSGSGFYELTTTPTELYSINLNSPYASNDLKVNGSRNASGTQIILTFTLDNNGAGTVDSNTTIQIGFRHATTKSYSNPSVAFSITFPSDSLSDWTGS